MSIYLIDREKCESSETDFSIEENDPSLNGQAAISLLYEFKLGKEDFNRLFLSRCGINYISEYFFSRKLDLRVLTHPVETNTCFEKAELLGGWDPLYIIKALYFEYSADSTLYTAVVPETGCFMNRTKLKEILDLPGEGFLKKSDNLPLNMSFGTCSPFITKKDCKKSGGKVLKILFDSETLAMKKEDKTLDDFSFGLDHRMSIQMNYYHCYKMLKKLFPDVVCEKELLNLSFREKLLRNNGKIHINYEFNSLNYSTAKFINSIHGYGDVSISNDYVDELDLPHVLLEQKADCSLTKLDACSQTSITFNVQD